MGFHVKKQAYNMPCYNFNGAALVPCVTTH